MRNKFLAAVLTLCMTSAMLPLSVSAEVNIPIVDGAGQSIVEEAKEEGIYFSDGQSIRRMGIEECTEPEGRATGEARNADAQQESLSKQSTEGKNLIQLPAPTDLTWGIRITGITGTGSNVPTTENVPGWMSWKIDYDTDRGDAGRDCLVKIYREGEAEPSATTNWNLGPAWEHGLYSIQNFILEDLDSGRYYFTVQWKGDGEEYSDSDVAKSEVWEYQKPENRLTSITKLEWDWPDLKWEYAGNVSDDYSFQTKLYFSETEDGEPRWISGGFGSSLTTEKIDDLTIQLNGKGYYYFMVRAISNDITKYQNGAWSELSPAYNLTEITEGVADSLDNILNNQGNSTPSEIRQQIREINRADLRSSMLADENVLNQIQQLEDKMTDIEVDVDIKDSRIEDFPTGQVKILGAKLNTPEENATKITLKIDEPKKEDLVIPGRYKNTLAVKFSMDIDGLDEAEDRILAVPVRITLPVPDNINPRRLSILHYSSGDTPECLESPFGIYTYQENGRWYVSFMVDHFSDFVMTEIMPAVITFNADGGICSTETLSVNEGNVLPEIPVATRNGYTFGGWYTEDGRKVDATTVFGEDATVTARWTKVSSSSSGSSSGSGYNPPAIVTSAPSTPTVGPTATPSGDGTPTGTPTPSGNETPIVTPSVTPVPTETAIPTGTVVPTPQEKAAQTLENRYNSKGKRLKREVGSALTQSVTGAKTAVTFESSNPEVAKVGKTSGRITCVGVGKATIITKAEESGQYKAAEKRATIYVIPKTAGIKSMQSSKKGEVTLKSTNNAKGNDGCQIQYKHDGKTKKVNVKGSKSISKTFKKLESGKAFKARIRAYKKVGSITYYGKYSGWKTVKKVE